jgi:Fic family protein
MDAQDGEPPERDEAPAVDALYRPFPDFSSWPRLGPTQRDLWAIFAAELNDQKRLSTADQLERAVAVAVRAAAIDTGAIEGLYHVDRGFTMSVALQAFAWEHALDERGEGIRELFEAQLAGYEMAIDAVTGKTPLSEAWLRVLHEQICAPQATYRVKTANGWQNQALPKGRYKELPNHVWLPDGSYHAYAPVAAVGPEMRRLFEQLRTPAFEEAHPVEQTAYVHYALAAVHPFADGNGRVARALASVFLYKSLSIPLVVYANQRPQYFDALAKTDEGDPGPWLAFVADRGLDTMQLVEETMRTAAGPRPDEVAESLGALVSPSDMRLHNLAQRILSEVVDRWVRAIDALSPRVFSARYNGPVNHQPPAAGYRIGLSQGFIVQRPPPFMPYEAIVVLRINIARDDSHPFRFQLEAPGSSDVLDVREQDVTPELTASLNLRLDQWVQRQLAALLVKLQQRARSELAGEKTEKP